MFFEKTNSNELLFPPRYPDRIGGPAAFGCSATWAEGVEINEDWPALLGLYNGAQPGSSNDRIVRLAIEYINEHRPDTIYVLWTLNTRREWIDSNGTPLRFNPTHKPNQGKFWHKAMVMLSNDEYDEYTFKKNKILLESFCTANNVKLVQLDMVDYPFHTYPLGSDGSHPGAEWHVNIANAFQAINGE